MGVTSVQLHRKIKTNQRAFFHLFAATGLFLQSQLHLLHKTEWQEVETTLPLAGSCHYALLQSNLLEVRYCEAVSREEIQEKKAREKVVWEVGVSRSALVTGDVEWQLSGGIRLMQAATQWVKERRRVGYDRLPLFTALCLYLIHTWYLYLRGTFWRHSASLSHTILFTFMWTKAVRLRDKS